MIYLDNNTFQQEIFIPRSSARNDAYPEYATKTELENAIENEVIRADGKYATKTDLLPYATTGWVESQDFATKEWTEEQIQSAITSETARTEETYQKISEMSAYSTTNEVESMIDDAVSGKADSSAVTAQISEVKAEIEAEIPTKVSDLQNDLNFASTGDVESMISGFTTSADVKTQIESYNYINSGQAQTQIDNSISGKLDTSVFNAYSASTYTILQNKVDTSAMTQYATTAFTENTYAKTGDIPTKTSDLTNDSGFITNAALSGYATEQYVDDASASTIDYVDDQFSEYSREFTGYLAEKQDISAMTAYYTSAQTDTAISNAVSGKVDTSTFEQAALYIEQEFINVGTALDGKVDTSAMTEYYTSAETETAIQNATSGLATEQYVDDAIAAIDIPTVPTNVSDFVNDAGYITSDDLIESGYTTQDYVDNALAETNNHIDNMEEMTATALLELKNTKADATALTEYAKAEHVAELEQVTSAALNDLNSNKADASALTAYATTEEVQDAEDHIDNVEEMTAIALLDLKTNKADATALTEYAKSEHLGEVEQVTSVALNNLETNKVGSTDVRNMVVVTQAQYNVLTPDPNTFYIIVG